MARALTRLVAYVIANLVAVAAVGTISDRWVSYDRTEAVLVFAVILGLINFFIKPVLKLLTLPLSCLTFGLFAIVLNALLFGLAAWLTPGFEIETWGAVIGSIVASVASGIIYSLVDERGG